MVGHFEVQAEVDALGQRDLFPQHFGFRSFCFKGGLKIHNLYLNSSRFPLPFFHTLDNEYGLHDSDNKSQVHTLRIVLSLQTVHLEIDITGGEACCFTRIPGTPGSTICR